jgi:hypothetical protein
VLKGFKRERKLAPDHRRVKRREGGEKIGRSPARSVHAASPSDRVLIPTALDASLKRKENKKV